MWGTGEIPSPPAPLGRFIPTYVGNSACDHRYVRLCTVHPHVCGEQTASRLVNAGVDGSSPRMWGTEMIYLSPVLCGRFIPTYVGNREWRCLGYRQKSVHPHVCGEQEAAAAFMSPVWRFIPTYVGNSISGHDGHSAIAVHPHVCGEQFIFTPPATPAIGSSPRMWGTERKPPLARPRQRFIPTYVGNRLVRFLRCLSRSVHPHVCGEQQ